jgi:hypothetical protein
MKEEGVVRSDIDAYSTAYLMSVFVVGIITMDEMMEPDAIPPFETLLSTMGSMMESYLSTDSPDASAKGKAILRQSMEQARTELTEER